MPRPRELPIIDLMLSIPSAHQKRVYDFMRPLFRDAESLRTFDFPAQYMFKEFPRIGPQEDYVAYTLSLMDAHGIEKALMGFDPDDPVSVRAVREHGDRFLPEHFVDPNRGMDEVRRIEHLHATYGLRAVSAFPAGTVPQVPIDDARYYPIFAKCVELGLPIFCCIGVPGPRIPMAPQLAHQLDAICGFFPELVFVVRHGAEPWAELVVQLMDRHPNLYFSTSAFSPRYYPEAVVEYANTRGADKVMYAGYFPAGLDLDRIMSDLDRVPFRDHVWPKFLHENARRVLALR